MYKPKNQKKKGLKQKKLIEKMGKIQNNASGLNV
jgi:hypothetical protein